MSDPVNNPWAFIEGQSDCQKGMPHSIIAGYSEEEQKDYDRGYNAEYEMQEIRTARTL